MDLRNSELLAILISPAFVIATTQVVRKYVKSLDGWRVPVFVLVLSEAVCIAERLLTQPGQWVFGIIAGILLAVVCLGANEKLNDLAKRVSLPSAASVGSQPGPAPTVSSEEIRPGPGISVVGPDTTTTEEP